MARFQRFMRVRSASDFARVSTFSTHAADEVLVINGGLNNLSRARLGLAVSRQVGNAVIRNRWKRLIREAFRLSYERLPSGIDFVVRPRRGAVPNAEAVNQSFGPLADRVARRLRSSRVQQAISNDNSTVPPQKEPRANSDKRED